MFRREPPIETLTWDEFFHVGDRAARTPAKTQAAAIALTASTLFLAPATTHAASLAPSGVLIHAFWPIISLLQGIAFPVAFLGMAGGMLMISVGQRRKGLDMVKWAAIGYIGMQLVPGMMEMLGQVGHSIALHP